MRLYFAKSIGRIKEPLLHLPVEIEKDAIIGVLILIGLIPWRMRATRGGATQRLAPRHPSSFHFPRRFACRASFSGSFEKLCRYLS